MSGEALGGPRNDATEPGGSITPPASAASFLGRLARFVGWELLFFVLAASALVVGMPLIAAWAFYCAIGAPGWGDVDRGGRCN